ncbi:MAG: hypothetical protein V4658_01705, partial [Bacteroidota bacterium]
FNSINYTPVNGQDVTAVRSGFLWTLNVSGPGVLKSAEQLKLVNNTLSSTNTFRKIALHKGSSPSGVYNSI